MYKIENIIPETWMPVFHMNTILVQQNDKNKNSNIKLYSEKWELLWSSPEQSVGNLAVTGNSILYSYDKLTKGIVRNISNLDNILLRTDFPISARSTCIYGNTIFGANKKIGFYRINGLSVNPITIFPFQETGLFYAVSSNFVVRLGKTGGHMIVSDWNLNTVWEKDITESATHVNPFSERKSEGKFSSAFFYKEHYLITIAAYNSVICYESATGKEIWRTIATCTEVTISENVCYLRTNRSLFKIDLDNGIKKNYEWENGTLPSFEFRDLSIKPIISEIIYHDGLLWALANNNGKFFILALNPSDGEYEWLHYVDAKEEIVEIKFYGNQMYLTDLGRNLYIYKKGKS